MKIKKKYYTLLELVVSMGVFAILLLVVSIIFSTAQRAWTQSNAKAELFESARVAMDVMTKELQAVSVYDAKDDKTPFWHKPENIDGIYSNEILNFIAKINYTRGINITKNCEVKYLVWYVDDLSSSDAGWLQRSVTSSGSKWNFQNNLTAGISGSSNAFTSNQDSASIPEKMIPFVTDLSFTCYDENGDIIDGVVDSVINIPFSVEINLTLLDKDSWKKWVVLAETIAGESANALAFRKNHERSFTKTILIGDRGQYD